MITQRDKKGFVIPLHKIPGYRIFNYPPDLYQQSKNILERSEIAMGKRKIFKIRGASTK